MPFFDSIHMPIFEYLSTETRQALETYLDHGNRTFRQKKLLEFFNALEWLQTGLDLDDLMAEGPAAKLTPTAKSRFHRDIDAYLASKAEKRGESAEKREQYRLRIYEYYRQRIPRADKILLESLRDYELNLTGRDANWRHHFTLDSFKKIDAFVEAGASERFQRFEAFKKDVDTYRKNYEKLHREAHCDHGFTFDDWCEFLGDENPRAWKQRQRQQAQTAQKSSPLVEAYRLLEVSPAASDQEIKKQFRRLTLQYHPDLPNGSEEKMKALVSAYETVTRVRQVG